MVWPRVPTANTCTDYWNSQPAPSLRPGPLSERSPPPWIGPIPGNCLGQSRLEVDLRLVAQLGPNLGDVDRVPQVVAEAVFDVLDAGPISATGVQQQTRELLVGQFGSAADVVDLA